VQNYEAAVKAMQEHKFDKAKACWRDSWPPGTVNSWTVPRVHLILQQQLAGKRTSFKNP